MSGSNTRFTWDQVAAFKVALANALATGAAEVVYADGTTVRNIPARDAQTFLAMMEADARAGDLPQPPVRRIVFSTSKGLC